MRLERHVGGLGRARKVSYLERRGWRAVDGQWLNPAPASEPSSLDRALHHQLTVDLTSALGVHGWKVVGYSSRGYAQLEDPKDQSRCSLPAALRRQARREGRPVAQLTYSLFLSAMVDTPEDSGGA